MKADALSGPPSVSCPLLSTVAASPMPKSPPLSYKLKSLFAAASWAMTKVPPPVKRAVQDVSDAGQRQRLVGGEIGDAEIEVVEDAGIGQICFEFHRQGP